MAGLNQTKSAHLSFLQDLTDPSDIRAEIDDNLDGPTLEDVIDEEITAARMEGFDKLIDLILDNSARDLKSKLEQGFREFIVLCHIVRPQMVLDASLRDLSAAMGLSHATLSKRQVNMADRLGLHFSTQKSKAARRTYSKLKKQNHWRHPDFKPKNNDEIQSH